MSLVSRWLTGRELQSDLPPQDSLAAPSQRSLGVAGRRWDGRLRVEAVALNGRAVEVEVRPRLDTVEVSRGGLVCAVFDRVELREWLDERPVSWLVCDEVSFSVQWGAGGPGRVTLSMAAAFGWSPIEQWTLSPADELILMAYI